MRLSIGYLISFAAGAVVVAAVLQSGAGAPPQLQAETEAIQLAQRSEPQQKKPPVHVRADQRVRADQLAAGNAARLPTHETVECCLKVAEDIDRHLAAKLREQREQNPQAFAAQLRHSGQRLLDLCELRSRDPALYDAKLTEMKYDVRVVELGTELCKAVDANNEKRVVQVEEELRANIRMQLVFEIKSRAEFLIKLQEEVERIRAELDAMGSQFETTVETRLAELQDCHNPRRPSWQQRERTVVPVTDATDIPEE